MKKILVRAFPYMRLTFYIIFFTTFIIIPCKKIESGSLCFFYNLFHIVCFSCGTTRAFSNIMHLNFSRAIMYNPMFTLVICPIFVTLFIQDSYIIFKRLITKKESYSIIETFFRGKL